MYALKSNLSKNQRYDLKIWKTFEVFRLSFTILAPFKHVFHLLWNLEAGSPDYL